MSEEARRTLGIPAERVEEEKPVVDIMTALKESIDQAKDEKKPMKKATGKKKDAAVAKPAKAKKQKTA